MAKKKHSKTVQLPLSPEKYIRNRCRTLPIGECMISKNWKEEGISNILITRKHSNGNLTVGVYLVDTYCLGLKHTLYRFNISTVEFRDMIEYFGEDVVFVPIDYALAHNIIFGAIEYAEDYGFLPDKDFLKTTQYILEEDNDDIELMDVEFGHEGKPFLIITDENEPYKNYMRTLDDTAGPGNYDFMLPGGESSKEDFDDEYFDYLEPTPFDDDIEEKVGLELEQMETWGKKEWEELENDERELLDETKTRMIEVSFLTMFSPEEVEETYEFSEKLFDIDIDDGSTCEVAISNENDLDSYSDVLELIYNNKPKKAIKILKELIAEYPDEPILLHYLITCFRLDKKKRKVDELIVQAYQRFPENLALKNNYISYLMGNGQLDEVEDMLGNNYALCDLCPDKEWFYERDVLEYYLTLVLFLIFTKQMLKAKAVFYKLKVYGMDDVTNELLSELLYNAMSLFVEGADDDSEQPEPELN